MYAPTPLHMNAESRRKLCRFLVIDRRNPTHLGAGIGTRTARKVICVHACRGPSGSVIRGGRSRPRQTQTVQGVCRGGLSRSSPSSHVRVCVTDRRAARRRTGFSCASQRAIHYPSHHALPAAARTPSVDNYVRTSICQPRLVAPSCAGKHPRMCLDTPFDLRGALELSRVGKGSSPDFCLRGRIV